VFEVISGGNGVGVKTMTTGVWVAAGSTGMGVDNWADKSDRLQANVLKASKLSTNHGIILFHMENVTTPPSSGCYPERETQQGLVLQPSSLSILFPLYGCFDGQILAPFWYAAQEH
jgi:hypothetical protein